MTYHYLKLFSALPDGQKPPGIHPQWAVTNYEFASADAPPPEEGLLGPLTDEEYAAYEATHRAAFEASLIDNAAAIAAWRDNLALPDAKAGRLNEIDAKTTEVIARGFAYDKKTFSLSSSAQSTLSNTFIAREMLTYPVRWNTLDDLDAHNLVDANDVTAMYAAGVTAVRAALDGGTALKDLVRAATTMEALGAIVDPR